MELDVNPLVSCIMPTADRRRFISHAIKCYSAQDYPNKELIIVDDGDDPVEDIVPHGENGIHYYRSSPRKRIGYKRNLCCDIARGEIIVHWDDDDWSAPWRVSYQVQAIEDGADICGLADALYYSPSTHKAWKFIASFPGSEYWVMGCTMAYRKSVWNSGGFRNLQTTEDDHFILDARKRGATVRVLPDINMFVAIAHSGNTDPKDFRWDFYQPVTRPFIYGVMGDLAEVERLEPRAARV